MSGVLKPQEGAFHMAALSLWSGVAELLWSQPPDRYRSQQPLRRQRRVDSEGVRHPSPRLSQLQPPSMSMAVTNASGYSRAGNAANSTQRRATRHAAVMPPPSATFARQPHGRATHVTTAASGSAAAAVTDDLAPPTLPARSQQEQDQLVQVCAASQAVGLAASIIVQHLGHSSAHACLSSTMNGHYVPVHDPW